MAASAMIFRSAVCRTTARYRPAPTLFYFPGLTSKPFHDDRSQFPWAELLERGYETILEEYLSVASRPGGVDTDYRLHHGEKTLHSGDWRWFSYVSKGVRQDRFRELCPNTTALLDSIPDLMADLPTDFAFFSTLKPGSSIAAHCAPHNLRIRCHLPLIVPKEGDLGIKVAGETRRWQPGKCLIFDDAYEHEVWHRGQGDRVVLLFDVWHPDLTLPERAAIAEMFAGSRRAAAAAADPGESPPPS